MNKNAIIIFVTILMIIVSCVNRNDNYKKGWQYPDNIIVDTGHNDRPIKVCRKDTTLNREYEYDKVYYIPFSKDSLMVIPGFAIVYSIIIYIFAFVNNIKEVE